MPIRRLYAPTYEAVPTDAALLFQLGPIQGAPDWHSESTSIAQNAWKTQPDDLYIACPRRLNAVRSDFTPAEKDKQLDWENDYIRETRDSRRGGFMVWFAAQDPDIEYPTGRAYAQTTRVEVGEIIGWREFMPSLPIAIGFDPNYKGGSEGYIRHKAKLRGIEVYDSLEVVTRRAVQSVINFRDNT